MELEIIALDYSALQRFSRLIYPGLMGTVVFSGAISQLNFWELTRDRLLRFGDQYRGDILLGVYAALLLLPVVQSGLYWTFLSLLIA